MDQTQQAVVPVIDVEWIAARIGENQTQLISTGWQDAHVNRIDGEELGRFGAGFAAHWQNSRIAQYRIGTCAGVGVSAISGVIA